MRTRRMSKRRKALQITIAILDGIAELLALPALLIGGYILLWILM